MILWRISRHRDLIGIGGRKAAGRWHYPGQPAVYLSENPASALLEVCVHTCAGDVPADFTLLKIAGPDLKIATIEASGLPDNWPLRLDITRDLGTQWLRKTEGALLQVPSAIVPQTANFLFNPLHPNASKFQIVEALQHPFDLRIKR